ncbi:Hypothetical predicted protein [Cloeon dipterum]|uniref:Bumetanide-sensitive sodium-(Potassium)-chloride cotransporter n=1 Tax=Cloeon dipterum TaxID=197152 RepID=A0A8S1E5P5_9INSE|nr:Hypothetical predicted protein [Cloeon dipterum]
MPLKGPRKLSGVPIELSEQSRFRVNRIDSVALGMHRDDKGLGSLPEDEVLDTTNGHANLAFDSGDEDDESRDALPPMPVTNSRRPSLQYQYTLAGSGTVYGGNLVQQTREALPRLDNYRDLASIAAGHRPTLDELRENAKFEKAVEQGEAQEEAQSGAVKFGWIQGVLVRCLLNIWGVMLFLRLSWVVAQAGIIEACVVVLLSATVTTLTALSMSAISTNGLVKGGGIYFMISRSLGPEFGAAVGLVFSMANAVGVALHTVGFAESMNDMLRSMDVKIIDNSTNDIRIVGTIAVTILLAICIIGMEWESKAQVGLLVILLFAIVDFLIGGFLGPLDDTEMAKGFVGLNATLFVNNLKPDFRVVDGKMHNFFSVFSIFFPSATGILAGANISGDLKDPSSNIPKGTLLAILLTTLSYLAFVVIAGAAVVRDASGNVMEIAGWQFANCTGRHCDWGLHNSFQVMELVSVFGPLIYAGCFAATLSSALACLVSAPKVFQALCKDKLYPYIEWFGKGYGKGGEAYRAYVLTFVIGVCFILIGDLNAIAPLISNFYLASYTLVNFCTFHASLTKPIGWRPTFKYYNTWLSLLATIICVSIMFLISWVTALITFIAVITLYLIVMYRKPDVNWGSTTQAQTYSAAMGQLQKLDSQQEHVKNYRPQILVFCGRPSARPTLVEYANLITKNLALLICGNIEKASYTHKARIGVVDRGNRWLRDHQKVKAFYTMVDGMEFEEGARALIQASGVGKMKPNILLMGYKSNWKNCNADDLKAYFTVLSVALDNHMGIAILRTRDLMDYTGVIAGEEEMDELMAAPKMQPSNDLLKAESGVSGMEMTPPATPENARVTSDIVVMSKDDKKKPKKRENEPDYKAIGGGDLPQEVINNLNQFTTKQKNGCIDVWWLYDDGGLTLLLPYIIKSRSNWENCRLRVFALANSKDDLEMEQISMANLLSKFRIDYSDLIMIREITRKPQDSSKAFFKHLIQDLRAPKGIPADACEGKIADAELQANREKTGRHLRLRELLQENSKQSNLVVMTMPLPRKGVVSAPLYMAWLETLTRDMPPFMLVRGNQSSVLTFYS